jgi:hypothetical protein
LQWEQENLNSLIGFSLAKAHYQEKWRFRPAFSTVLWTLRTTHRIGKSKSAVVRVGHASRGNLPLQMHPMAEKNE